VKHSMITNERRDECLCYLAETDSEFAKSKSYMIGLELQKNTILAVVQLEGIHKTVGDNKAEAYMAQSYLAWQTNYVDAIYDYELFRNKRNTAALVVDLWRSEFSARKQGVII